MTIEPKAPAPDWAKRWAMLALDLMQRKAAILVLGTLAFNLHVAVLAYLLRAAGMDILLSLSVVMVVGRVVGVMNLFWVLHVVMQADGHRPAQPFLSSASVGMMMSFAMVEIALLVLRMMMFGPALHGAALSVLLDGGEVSLMLQVAIVGGFHAGAMASVLLTFWIFGMFWPPIMVSLGVPFVQYATHLHPLLTQRLGNDRMRMTILGFVFALLAGSIFSPLSQIASVFGMVWLYVGAREMFGGISQNGKEEVRESSMAGATPEAG